MKLKGELTGITLPHPFLLHTHIFFTKNSLICFPFSLILSILWPLVLHFTKLEGHGKEESSDGKPSTVYLGVQGQE